MPVSWMSASQENEQRLLWVGGELRNITGCVKQRSEHFCGGTVPQAQPYDFGREAAQDAALVEVDILADHDVSVVRGALPDHFIVGALEAEFDNVSRAGERFGQLPDEVSREVLIEQELHAGRVKRRRSRSAA